MTQTGFSARDDVLDYLRRHLIGPGDGEDELLKERPHQRYLSAVLYPIAPPLEETDGSPDNDDEIVDECSGHLVDDEDAEDAITLSGQQRPSSAGISFVTTARSAVTIEVEAGLYHEVDDDSWQRTPLRFVGHKAIRLDPPQDESWARATLREGISVEACWRPSGEGGNTIVTVVLVNRRRREPRSSVDPHDCLFQVVLRCRPATGTLCPYPGPVRLHRDEEAEELDLLYRKIPVFAVGHGVSAHWDPHEKPPAWVETSFLPTYVVPDVAFDVDQGKSVLALHRLADIDLYTETITAELHEFVDGYLRWIEGARKVVRTELDRGLVPAAERLVERMTVAESRMRDGIRLLAENRLVRRAFGLTNRAMLMQMVHSGQQYAGTPHTRTGAPQMPEDYDRPDLCWRPFQLGFLLLTLRGAVEQGAERDLVDLIWFPTGGGKTEAYLGLAAFVILHRRLSHGDDGAGTTLITRYTLRLLTTQQFQRAATMVLACDLIRRRQPDVLGSRPLSIGIWVGGGNSPNHYAEAVQLLERLQQDKIQDRGFQVELCPWCGTTLAPGPEENTDRWGIYATNNSIRFFCRNDRCDFATGIPISSVDEDLYDHPPTLLVGTVDKFARAAWDARTGVFFGTGSDPGPSLIIQDEFHLISGPLGTIVGLYEAAFDVVMRRRGLHPKIVAATATIRRANEQTCGVFGRDAALFPPSGLDADNSYFVSPATSGPGRAYVGVMPQGHTPLTALVHLASALLQAPVDVALPADVRDGYWTLVAYHNSLRELGKTITLAHDDIPARLKILARAEDDCRPLDDDQIVELTSNVPAVSIPQILDRLGHQADARDAISLLASTNMISVGVDVSRLGLMAVVGQPKTTAEYIQATSRVGRSKERPGLVVTLYSPSKPRDRSHYESFVPYHATLYSSVEPTSVTPFSVPARQRALHADLVILARHALGLANDDQAGDFDPDEAEFREIVETFLDRVGRADPTELDRVRVHLRDLIDEWRRRAVNAGEDDGLYYSGPRTRNRLMKQFNHTGEGWPTLNSMRSVDVELKVRVRGTQR
jgi:hypothetical protein